MELKDVHNCEKCRGKIVVISISPTGITRCAYCNQIVDYQPFFNEKTKEVFGK